MANSRKEKRFSSTRVARRCREPSAACCGSALSQSVPTSGPSLRLTHSVPTTLRRQLLTLLFLEAVGLRRTWDLRGYTGQALALLTGRRLAYGYRHIERFLAELAQVGADEMLTQALASWTASLWKPQACVTDGSVP